MKRFIFEMVVVVTLASIAFVFLSDLVRNLSKVSCGG